MQWAMRERENNDLQNTKRPKTAPSRKVWLTKDEIQKALPRKSFFSCHDNKIRKARLENDDITTMPTKLKANPSLPRASTAKTSLTIAQLSFDLTSTDETKETRSVSKATFSKTDKEAPKVADVGDSKTKDKKSSWGVIKDKALSRKVSEVLDAPGQTHSNLMHENSDLFLFDCKPLFEYLKFVKNNKEEWLATYGSVPPSSQTQYSFASAAANSTESYLVTASYEVGARRSYLVGSKHHQEVTHDKHRKSHPEDKKSAKFQDGTEVVDEVSEIDRLRQKAKLWAESVSTSTLIRCRIKCLQALGEEDPSLTSWWTSLQTCTYLR